MPPRRPTPPPAASHRIDPAALGFLAELRRHNRRDWFESHREDYHRLIRDPLRALIEEVDVLLAGELPELVGDPRRSAFRIHRDVRFSHDKSPYKTHAAAWFRHRDAATGSGESVHGGAGFYLHIEPGASMVAAGIWMPSKPSLDLIRAKLLEHSDQFAAILTQRDFQRRMSPLSEEAMLVRAPRGTDPTHPAAPWLRYKSFTVHRDLTDQDITSPRLLTALATDLAAVRPLVRWLNDALGLAPLDRRT
jgi:uncharacterized protein (TIGR02453 family)